MKNSIKHLLEVKPNLKGAEIAAILGWHKKEINSFLAQNKESYVRDEADFTWNNKDSLNVREIKVDFPSGWIDANTYENEVLAGRDFFEDRVRVSFVFKKNTKLLLEVIARFISLINQLNDYGVKVVIDLDNCSDSLSYLNRAGFFELANKGIIILPKRPISSTAQQFKGKCQTLVEFGEICPNSENKQLKDDLRTSFITQTSPEYANVATLFFAEFIGNVSDHSESKLKGFSGLQLYSPPNSKKHIQAVISDSGRGVVSTLRTTLKHYYPDLYKKYPEDQEESDIGLALEVFSKGKITRFGKSSGRGLGFKSTSDNASKFDANLSIRLMNFSIQLIYRKGELISEDILRNLTYINGTHICFDFIID
ncbi:ATP-binding protein [Acinetobacter seifertii]|uniref:ATP-binding protein n=1 Tax=Acinetobacter seifertii TaxID=1530123 RepID=UPI00321A7E8D